jgi:hypothetical protein
MNISLNSKGNEETPKDLKPSNTLRVLNHQPNIYIMNHGMLCPNQLNHSRQPWFSKARKTPLAGVWVDRDGNSLFVQATGTCKTCSPPFHAHYVCYGGGGAHAWWHSFASHTIRSHNYLGGFLMGISISLQSEVPNYDRFQDSGYNNVLMENRKKEPAFEYQPIFFFN